VRALRRRGTALDRRALVRALVKVRLKHLLRRGGRSEHVLGFHIHFADRDQFTALFEEIFVNEQYRLPAGADAPFIIDAGANIGMATLYFKAVRPLARILAIEPEPAAAALLRRNVEGLDGVDVLEAALSETDGTLTLFHDPARPASVLATTKPGVYAAGAEVPAVRLSSRVEPETAMVKLDIEGMELDVLRELTAAGALSHIGALAIEVGLHHPDPDEHGLGRILTLLEDNAFGYAISAPYLPPIDERAPQNVLVRAWRHV
jgi:FkbM family methyltransferase